MTDFLEALQTLNHAIAECNRIEAEQERLVAALRDCQIVRTYWEQNRFIAQKALDRIQGLE